MAILKFLNALSIYQVCMAKSIPTLAEAEATSAALAAAEAKIWDSLKGAIASTSGFQSWQTERNLDNQLQELSLDRQVRRYLRETLETLAY